MVSKDLPSSSLLNVCDMLAEASPDQRSDAHQVCVDNYQRATQKYYRVISSCKKTAIRRKYIQQLKLTYVPELLGVQSP